MARIVLLVGNGFSRGIDDRYAVGHLTTTIRARLQDQGIWPQVAELVTAMVPELPDGAYDPNFEDFAGAVDRTADIVRVLQTMPGAGMALLQQLHGIRAELATWLTRIVGTALHVVDDVINAPLMDADGNPIVDDRYERARAFGRRLWTLRAHGHDVVVYTLNYDSLLMHGLLRTAPEFNQQWVYDGFVDDAAGNGPVVGKGLQTPFDRWPNRMALYHVHGAIGWSTGADGRAIKRTMDDVRLHGILQSWEAGDSQTYGVPAVVLGNRKDALVSGYPFAEFYRQLHVDLSLANRLAIGGYGFGDLPLNRLIGDALRTNGALRVTVWSPTATAQLPDNVQRLHQASGTPAHILEARVTATDVALPDGGTVDDAFTALGTAGP